MREEIDNKLKQNLVSKSKTITDLTRQLDNLKRKVNESTTRKVTESTTIESDKTSISEFKEVQKTLLLSLTNFNSSKDIDQQELQTLRIENAVNKIQIEMMNNKNESDVSKDLAFEAKVKCQEERADKRNDALLAVINNGFTAMASIAASRSTNNV
jgi:hypothetical protein